MLAGPRGRDIIAALEAARVRFVAALPDIVTSFKAFGGLDIGGDVAQYALKRSVNGKTKIYLIEFLRDGDGVWRLDSW